MFSQIQIEEWVNLTDQSFSIENNDIIEMGSLNLGTDRDLKIFLLELRSQVERWDLITTNYIFHPLFEEHILETLIKDLDVIRTLSIKQMRLWGSDLTVSPFMPLDKVLAIDIQTLNPIQPKCVALGKIDLTLIKRLNNLKAFW